MGWEYDKRIDVSEDQMRRCVAGGEKLRKMVLEKRSERMPRMIEEVKLGNLVQDSITGFEGVVTARYEYLYGCVRLNVQPQTLHEGKPVEAQVFDEQQLDLVDEKPDIKQKPSDKDPGGPRDAVPYRAAPKR